jgi:hypothetical protein
MSQTSRTMPATAPAAMSTQTHAGVPEDELVPVVETLDGVVRGGAMTVCCTVCVATVGV